MADQYDAPPVSADDIEFPDLPSWPKTIGITSVVISSIALFCGLGGTILQMSGVGGSGPPGAPPMPQPPPTMWAYGGANGLLNLLLLVAGIATLMRKPVGRPLHLAHAALKIPLTIWGVMLSLALQATQQEYMKEHMPEAAAISAMIGLVILLLACTFSFGWPLFLLIWFGLVKRNNADLAKGVVEAAA